MQVREVLTKLTRFKSVVEKELQEIKSIEYNASDKEEEFLFNVLTGIVSDFKFAIENIDYLNKPVCKNGNVNIKSGKFYLDDLELQGGDCIEVLNNNFWEQINIFHMENEFYAENLIQLLKENNNNLFGRIRLTKEDLQKRK